jgi:two-component system chemotaxis response regulator CheY
MKVLVCDDSRVMRQIVVRTLRQAGFDGLDIVEAANGAEGLDVVAAEQPDLVLSDWNMPELTGIDFLTHLRARGDDTPFGFVTSEGSQEMRERAAGAGALFVIAKPFDADTFADTLSPVLG